MCSSSLSLIVLNDSPRVPISVMLRVSTRVERSPAATLFGGGGKS